MGMINRLWWIHPGNLLILLVLPVFVLGATLGAPYMQQFGTYNFLTLGMVTLGVVGVTVMASGAMVGAAVTSRHGAQHLSFEPRSFDLALVAFLIITLIAYLLLLGPLILDTATVFAGLSGERGAIYLAKQKMFRIFGVTSLTNLAPVVLCMSSIRFLLWGKFFPPRATLLAAFLPILILFHAFVGTERIVLFEAAVAFMLPLFTFWERLRVIGRYVPILGVTAVVVVFAAGEYTRTWPYYAAQYDSFAQFAATRLLAYIAVASNTGAGIITTMPPVGYPLVTARWFTRLPFLFDTSKVTYQDQYFRSFGNAEFNNPGGIMAPIIDFGIPIGLGYLFLFGILLGFIYGLYRTKHPVGLLAYPIFFVGLLDLTQIWFWGEPRFIPRLLFLAIAILVCVRRQVLRNA